MQTLVSLQSRSLQHALCLPAQQYRRERMTPAARTRPVTSDVRSTAPRSSRECRVSAFRCRPNRARHCCTDAADQHSWRNLMQHRTSVKLWLRTTNMRASLFFGLLLLACRGQDVPPEQPSPGEPFVAPPITALSGIGGVATVSTTGGVADSDSSLADTESTKAPRGGVNVTNSQNRVRAQLPHGTSSVDTGTSSTGAARATGAG